VTASTALCIADLNLFTAKNKSIDAIPKLWRQTQKRGLLPIPSSADYVSLGKTMQVKVKGCLQYSAFFLDMRARNFSFGTSKHVISGLSQLSQPPHRVDGCCCCCGVG
jgi:hypothetical protein